MSSLPQPRRPIVLKASRDTLVLLAAAGALTLGIAYSVHSRPAPAAAQGQTDAQVARPWAGQLAELSPNQAAAAAAAEPLSSAALTVPKAAMALPVAPRPAAARPRSCDGAPCPAQAKAPAGAAGAASAHRPASAAHPAPVREASLVERLNPLTHLPDAVKRPFASASDTIADWVKRF